MYVFVYGTLTDPSQVDRLLEADRYSMAGRASLEGLHRVDARYPTLAPGGSVDGRLLQVDPDALERLDQYEGVDDGLYARVSVPFQDGDESAAVYVGDPDRLGRVNPEWWPSGSSLRDRVRTMLEGVDPVVRRHE